MFISGSNPVHMTNLNTYYWWKCNWSSLVTD